MKIELSFRQIGIIIISFCILLAAAFYIARSQKYYRVEGSDFFSLWLAPHMLLHGQDPYDAAAWVPAHETYEAEWVSDTTFLYPLPLAVVLIPFGALGLDVAAVSWTFLSLAAIILSTYGLMRGWQPQPFLAYFLPTLAGMLLFRPTFLTLLLGQMDGLLLLCLVAAALLWERQSWLEGGMLVALVLLKPQVGIPLLAMLGIWLLFQRKWKALAGIGLAAVGLFVLGAVFDPAWAGRLVSIGQGKVSGVFGYSPTLWGVAATVCRHGTACTSMLGGSLSLLVILLGGWIILGRKVNEPRVVMGAAIAAALLVTPYLWAYTQILLLIPILVTLEFLHRRGTRYLAVATFPLAMSVVAFALLFVAASIGMDIWSAAVPLASLIMLAITAQGQLTAAQQPIPDRDGPATSRQRRH